MSEMKPEDHKGGLWHLIRFFLGMHMKPVPNKKEIMQQLMLDCMQILTSYSFGSSKELKDDLDEIEVTRGDAQIATAFVVSYFFIHLDKLNTSIDSPLKGLVKDDPFFKHWPYTKEDL